MKWKRKPQERSGTYMFSGQFLITRGVQESLNVEETLYVYAEIQRLVRLHRGLDYLQIYVHQDSGQKIFFIDQLNREMIASGDHPSEHNHCTLLLSEEY